MPVPDTVKLLVERFERNHEQYRSSKYNETQARREFIDPFFKALGWDIDNEQGFAEQYKEVIHEDTLEIEGASKAPDYAFRIGGTRKFFVEAKKPSVKLETDIHPAYQLRRYAWSAKLPLSVLTDFEEFAIYDCRVKPDKNDKASVGRVVLYSYREYVEKWDEIANIFSKDAILRGSFDKYAEGIKGKKGTAEVDDAFLEEIERWRELLAKNIALRNEKLSVRELNFAVQATIDRIVFLRICEDRGVERDEQLKAIAEEGDIYSGLRRLFQLADARYNSGLFHFAKEKDESSAADSLTLGLKIDDKVLQDILQNLYYPDSPYVFREIPSDILGQVYERFLGKVIRLTAGHQAKVEEKPEVRKAGGVYYTPTYIVDYIVQNTVGKLLEGESPKEVVRLKILDPACGSGTFPLGAYQYLLDWHLKWYTDHEPEKLAAGKEPAIYQSKDGWRLTTSKKKEILLNNIHGVDIDPQAVEVTKLSLLLKVLEGESQETIGSQLGMFKERVLPDLGRNIKCGNSLIGSDYYQDRQLTMLIDEEERYRVNAFDWKTEFSQVFIQGGFDVVIGNPPYIRIQTLQETSQIDVEFYKKRYKAASKGNYDVYVVFVEKGLSLLNDKGRLGFILPHKFFNAQYGEPLRGVIAKGKHLAKVVHFGDQQVFDGATTYTCLMFLDKVAHDEFEFEKVQDLEGWRIQTSEVLKTSEVSVAGKINANRVTESEWNFSVGANAVLFEKLSDMPTKLEDVTLRIFQGIKTSADKIYIVEEKERDATKVKVYSKEKNAEFWLEPDLLHPLVKGGDSKRYHLSRTNRLLLFPYAVQEDKAISLIAESVLKTKYPLTWDYLVANKAYLENREDGKMKGNRWYAYIYPKNFDVISLPKIFTPDIAARSSFSLDEIGECYFTGGAAGGYGILVAPEFSREYILGLLNSRLLEWYLHQVGTTMRGGWYSYESRFIHSLPIYPINFSDPADQARHDKMVSLVERMLELHKTPSAFGTSPRGGRTGGGRTPQEQEMVKREIESTDREIDQLVYELYGLSEEEIKIVEGT